MIYFIKNVPILTATEVANDEAERFDDGKTINLLEDWDQIGENNLTALENVGDTIAWLNTFSVEESYLEDLKRMDQHFLNSMNQDLHEEVESYLEHEFPSDQWDGPLTFVIMIDKCIDLSETVIDILKGNIEHYKISSIPGNNIEIAVHRFLYAFKRLKIITPSPLYLSNHFSRCFKWSQYQTTASWLVIGKVKFSTSLFVHLTKKFEEKPRGSI